MPLYLTRFSYTPATWAKLIKNPENRRGSGTAFSLSVPYRPCESGDQHYISQIEPSPLARVAAGQRERLKRLHGRPVNDITAGRED